MSGQIRITPEKLRERAREYGVQADELGTVIQRLEQLLVQLQEEWEGAASDSYAQRYEQLKPGFLKAEELIREIEKVLIRTADTIEQTDLEIAGQFIG
ncbi:MAG: WXG100 family type VII secretion target [Lachnospiraceae bacterium]|nr:WXG100 family type VII secretion target [Robinsoniella sp.]MDY3767304.1 WXG100 family type VII secretion target [Lachnospiraceae bacterium]